MSSLQIATKSTKEIERFEPSTAESHFTVGYNVIRTENETRLGASEIKSDESTSRQDEGELLTIYITL